MALIRFLCRIIPAFTFIFSGIVKAIDPVGGAIKLEDYFIAFHLEALLPLALSLAVILASFEFLLGFYLLIGFYTKKLAPVAFYTMLFFTVLTLYIAIFEPVKDCGCFGDAIKLTNWQTFWKNIVVIAFALGLFLLRKTYSPNTSGIFRTLLIAVIPAIYIVSIGVWGINNLPVIDFRPFKIGTHIASQMEIPEGAERPELETLFILEKNGERKTFTMHDYPYDDTTWVFIDTETKVIKEGFQPPLHDFHLMDPDLGDETQRIVNHEGPVFLMISPRLGKINSNWVLPFAELAEAASEKNIPFYCVTASGSAETMEFDLKHKTMFRFLHSDETTLKTMIRSNPGLILIYDGTITGKWHYRNLPDKALVQNPLAYSTKDLATRNQTLVIWLNLLIIILLATLTFNIKTINRKK